MKKTIRDVIILFLIGTIITGLVWYFLGLEIATITLVGYGILLEILSIVSKKPKEEK